jgi:hypothetical protein
MYGFDALVLVGHKEIMENKDATISVTNSIAGLARYNGDRKKAVKKMALLPNLQGHWSGFPCWITGRKAKIQLKPRNINHIQNDHTSSPLFPLKQTQGSQYKITFQILVISYHKPIQYFW